MSGTAVAAVRLGSVRRLKRRMRGLEEQHAVERERTRIARDMHDHVGARVTQMALLSDMALRDTGSACDAKPILNQISETARGLVLSMDEIVWAVNPRNDCLVPLIEYLSRFADEVFGAAGMRCQQRLPRTIPPVRLSSEVRHNIFLAVQEAFNNVLKHAGGTEIWFEVALEEKALRIQVRDNGRGFDARRIVRGNGLENLEERMRAVQGACTIESSEGQGTTVTLKIPLRISPETLGGAG